ncbi:glycosyltransferase [Providencia huaxiensis]|uniref:glycosyltransferase n=2 Tax=Providencia huaxiensis TaxID=2027290 RepID=UPI0034DCD9AE
MKIILFINSLSGGGGERVFVQLANEWAKYENIEVHLIVGSDFGPNKSLLSDGVKLHSLSPKCSNISILYGSFLKLLPLLLKIQPDIILSTLDLSNSINVLISPIYKFIKKEKVIIVTREANILSTNGVVPNHRSLSNFIINKVYQKFIYNSNLIIANSPDTRLDIINIRKVINNKIVFLPNPVLMTEPKFEPLPQKTHSSTIKLISIGRLTRQKNYELSLKIIYELKLKGYSISYDIYGTGEELDNLQDLAKKLDIEDIVCFKGYKNNISHNMHQYDAFLIMSKWEGFGNVIVEALSNGLPVISSNCRGGPSFILSENYLGSMHDESNINDICYSIIKTISQDTDDISRKKRIMYSKKFLVSHVAKEYLDIILSVKHEK